MGKIEQHETRLDEHDVKIDKIDVKVDVIDSTTKGTAIAVGTLIKKKEKTVYNGAEGTINQRDWLGTISIILFGLIQLGVMAWQLWSVQNGKDNIFLASLSVMAIPVIIAMGKALTGRDIKKSDTTHLKEMAAKEKEFKAEIDRIQGVMQLKIVENFGLKEDKARLEERQEVMKKLETPSDPKLPPN